MKRLGILGLFLIFIFIMLHTGFAGASKSNSDISLTIIHTNDMHSHILGFSPNKDYSPEIINNDKTVGGWARISTIIKRIRKQRKNKVLVFDGGDFMMGSLYHTISREHALELQLLKLMGYDALTLGNHEFDLKPAGLAKILRSAQKSGNLPDLLLANAIFSKKSSKDDSLEKAFQDGLVKPYKVLIIQGKKVGLFGLIGKNAAEVAPFSKPVKFGDPIVYAKKMVQLLQKKEKVDYIICLSHGGLNPKEKKSEDVQLAKQVPQIDVIISGHTHTKQIKPLQVGKTTIVQAWCYGMELGVLDFNLSSGRMILTKHQKIKIDDSIPGDPVVMHKIKNFENLINKEFLSKTGFQFRQIIAETNFNLMLHSKESNLGNLIADAIRWSINRHLSPKEKKVQVAVVSNGVIRDDILKGQTGQISVADAFRAIPLGVGVDNSIGYPLISFYITPNELKKGLEVITSIYPIKGSDYFIQVSGVKFYYNPNRMIFDRVTDIWLGDEKTGYKKLDKKNNKQLIRIAADIYNATFLKIVGRFTWNILNIVPKDAQGKAINKLANFRIDANLQKSGIQELKEWQAVLNYFKSFPDLNGNNIPDVPQQYMSALGRIQVNSSFGLVALVRGGNWLTWSVFSGILIITLLIFGVLFKIRKKLRKA